MFLEVKVERGLAGDCGDESPCLARRRGPSTAKRPGHRMVGLAWYRGGDGLVGGKRDVQERAQRKEILKDSGTTG